MILHYLKSFLISIKKNRFFYAINLTGFLAGFLLLTIIVTFVYQEFSFDRFHKDGKNIYRIHSGGYGVTPLCFGEKLKNQLPEMTGLVRFNGSDLTAISNGVEVKIGKTFYTDAELFQIFSFRLISGNEATVLKDPFAIVINKSTALKLFGKPTPMGETITDKKGLTYTITGIMEDIPYNSHIQANAIISLETLRHNGDESTFNCGNWNNLTFVRLTNDANVKDFETKINMILADSRMGTSEGKFVLKLEPLEDVYFDSENNKFDGCPHGNLQMVLLYLAISILILFIVIVNYINLSTAISSSRMKEISIRKVNGADRKHIIGQILLESIGIAVLSYFIALLIIGLLLPQLSSLLNLPVSTTFDRSTLYIWYFAGILLIGIVTGLFPGIFLSRINEIKALKDETVFNSRGIQRKLLLVFQLTIVVVMLNTTFVIRKQIGYFLEKDPGFRMDNVIVSELDPLLEEKYELLKNNLLKNPGVESVAFSNGTMGESYSKSPQTLGDVSKICNMYSIDSEYIAFYGLKMKYGRGFSPDLKTDANCCIVNEETCKTFGIENLVGQMLGKREVIGVVNNFNFASLHNRIEPLVMKYGPGKIVQIRISAQNQPETISSILNTFKSISSGFDSNYTFLENRIKKLYKPELDLKDSFEVYSFITFVIALLGLFGLTLFLLKKKTKEMSIRKLHGATLADTFRLLSKEQIFIAIISNLIGFPMSLYTMNQWLVNFQYKVDIGYFIFLETFLITIVFTLLAVSFLIIKTHRMNLVKTLKRE